MITSHKKVTVHDDEAVDDIATTRNYHHHTYCISGRNTMCIDTAVGHDSDTAVNENCCDQNKDACNIIFECNGEYTKFIESIPEYVCASCKSILFPNQTQI